MTIKNLLIEIHNINHYFLINKNLIQKNYQYLKEKENKVKINFSFLR